MNEKQRCEYLEAMGVPVFVPRFQLPCAAESVQAPLPIAQEAALVKPSVSDSAQVHVSTHDSAQARPKSPEDMHRAASFVQSVLADADVKTSKTAAASERVSEPTASTAEASHQSQVASPAEPMVEPFALSVWHLGEGLLVIDQRKPAAGLPTQQLLQNILASLGARHRMPSPEVLQWPMGNEKVSKLADAKAMVDGFLMGRYATQPFKTVWLMGGVSQQIVASLGQAEQQKPMVTLEHYQAQALLLPSLHDLLVQPQKKAAVWQVLSQYHFES